MNTLRRNTMTMVMLALTSLALARCMDRAKCDELRQELYDKRKAWAACETDADCLAIGGNPKDCTGVLACPFAVNRIHREEAEREMLSSGDQSVDCHLCATPTCAETAALVCEPVTRRCILAGETFDAAAGMPPEPDAAPPETGSPSPDAGDDGGVP